MRQRQLTTQQVRRIRRRLLSWGRSNRRDYAWRTETDAWLTLVAEVLLQRTRARQVESVYEEFRRRYATPLALLRADPNEAAALVGKLGLGFRLGFLREIAAVAVRRGGCLPEDVEELCKLRGIGEYTAAAWLSLHRGRRAVLVDSNVVRWLSRMTGNTYNRDPRGLTWVKGAAESLTPFRAFRDYNYAVLDFTMEVCTPRKPDCDHCINLADCCHGQQR